MLTIARFSDRTGLSASALRFYERKGLLVPAQRLSNGYRVYALSQVKQARFINSLREAGLSLASIRAFLSARGAARTQLLEAWRAEVAARMLSLQIANQYLDRLEPDAPQIHLERWDAPSEIAWVPVSGPAGPLPFLAELEPRKRELTALGYRVLAGGFARVVRRVGSRLEGELGFRIQPRRRKAADVRVETVPPALFATLECRVDDQKAAHRVFDFLTQFGFAPTGVNFERYLPGATDRYLLMIAVAPQSAHGRAAAVFGPP